MAAKSNLYAVVVTNNDGGLFIERVLPSEIKALRIAVDHPDRGATVVPLDFDETVEEAIERKASQARKTPPARKAAKVEPKIGPAQPAKGEA